MSKSLSHLERRRAGHTLSALWWMINAVKERTDPSDWGRMGLFEVVDLAHALKRGGEQPVLKLWQNCKSGTHRPAPGLQERRARRLAVLLCIALEQVGLLKSDARRTAAKALAKIGYLLVRPRWMLSGTGKSAWSRPSSRRKMRRPWRGRRPAAAMIDSAW